MYFSLKFNKLKTPFMGFWPSGLKETKGVFRKSLKKSLKPIRTRIGDYPEN